MCYHLWPLPVYDPAPSFDGQQVNSSNPVCVRPSSQAFLTKCKKTLMIPLILYFLIELIEHRKQCDGVSSRGSTTPTPERRWPPLEHTHIHTHTRGRKSVFFSPTFIDVVLWKSTNMFHHHHHCRDPQHNMMTWRMMCFVKEIMLYY